MKQSYNLELAITLHDLKQIKKEPPQKKIKTKNRLAHLVFKTGIVEGTKDSIYHKFVRYERDGFKREDEKLTEALIKVLGVSREELVIKI